MAHEPLTPEEIRGDVIAALVDHGYTRAAAELAVRACAPADFAAWFRACLAWCHDRHGAAPKGSSNGKKGPKADPPAKSATRQDRACTTCPAVLRRNNRGEQCTRCRKAHRVLASATRTAAHADKVLSTLPTPAAAPAPASNDKAFRILPEAEFLEKFTRRGHADDPWTEQLRRQVRSMPLGYAEINLPAGIKPRTLRGLLSRTFRHHAEFRVQIYTTRDQSNVLGIRKLARKETS